MSQQCDSLVTHHSIARIPHPPSRKKLSAPLRGLETTTALNFEGTKTVISVTPSTFSIPPSVQRRLDEHSRHSPISCAACSADELPSADSVRTALMIESKKRISRIAARTWFLKCPALCVWTLICVVVFQPPLAAAAPPAGTRAAAAAGDAEVAAVEASFGWHGDPLGHLDGSEGAAFVAPCLPSGLAGFSHSVVLSEAGLILHWVRRNLLFLEFALEARFGSGAENGWVAVGWSHDGRMVPSMAIVGSPAGIAAQAPGGKRMGSGGKVGVLGGAAGVASYAISGYKLEDVRRLVETTGNGGGEEVGSGGEGWSIYTSARGSTVMRFSRSLASNPPILNTSTTAISTPGGGTPSNEPTYSMSHHVLWAHSDRREDVLRYHGNNRGSAFVDYMCDLLASPARQSCQPSTLPGYTCMLQLQGDSFTLHWHLTPSSLLLAADVATTGWIALGWSKDGKMASSEAAIGNLPRGTIKTGGGADVAGKEEQAVGSFLIGGYERSAIRPALKFTVTNSSVTTTSRGRTVMKFERPLVNGQLPLSAADVATIIWAYSNEGSRKLTFHGNNRGAVSINLVTGESITASPPPSSPSASAPPHLNKPAIIAHAICLITALLILMPSAILLARICLVNLPGNDENCRTSTSSSSSSGLGTVPLGRVTHTGPLRLAEANAQLDASMASFAHAESAADVAGAQGATSARAAQQRRQEGRDMISQLQQSRAFWFAWHKYLQVAALVCIFIGCITAFVSSGTHGLSHTHAWVGIAVLILLLVCQPLVIFLRPRNNRNGGIDQPQFAMWTKTTWHWMHWTVGIAAVVMGWANIFLGMNLYFSFIGSDPFGLEAFLGIIMAVFVIVYMLFVCRDQLEKSKSEGPQYSAYASRA